MSMQAAAASAKYFVSPRVIESAMRGVAAWTSASYSATQSSTEGKGAGLVHRTWRSQLARMWSARQVVKAAAAEGPVVVAESSASAELFASGESASVAEAPHAARRSE